MKLSPRETMLACTTGLTVLAAFTYMFTEPKVRELAKLRIDQRKLQNRIEVSRRLVDQKPLWSRRLQEVSNSLTEYPQDKDVTADLLILLERISKQHGLTPTRREAQPEKKVGEIYEMAISWRWEAALDSLVHFLLEVQNQGAMLDISQLSVTPEKGVLKGGFTINGAYRKGIKAPAAPPHRAGATRGDTPREGGNK